MVIRGRGEWEKRGNGETERVRDGETVKRGMGEGEAGNGRKNKKLQGFKGISKWYGCRDENISSDEKISS